jgi:hypothetical protein
VIAIKLALNQSIFTDLLFARVRKGSGISVIIDWKASKGKVCGLIFTVAVNVVLLSGCVVNITGPMSWDVSSDPRALTDVLTGTQVADCVPLGAKVGDMIKLENGDMAEVKSISANQTRCTNPERQVRANVERKSVVATSQTELAPTIAPVTAPVATPTPSLVIAPVPTTPSSSLSHTVAVPAGAELKFGKICEGLGFQRTSAGFAQCVNELVNRDAANNPPVQMSGNALTCKNLGFAEDSQAFRSCVVELNARSR